MEDKEKLLRIIHLAFLEIREEAHEIENKKIFFISNLLHNLPLLLKNENANYKELLESLRKDVAHYNMERWLEDKI